ncbi:hypothetical protein FB451DRAFT_1185887 [Mycena latifolia]|nr:hypothetical protein FB451DRAFT_1185887 [Mycena latifolia]
MPNEPSWDARDAVLPLADRRRVPISEEKRGAAWAPWQSGLYKQSPDSLKSTRLEAREQGTYIAPKIRDKFCCQKRLKTAKTQGPQPSECDSNVPETQHPERERDYSSELIIELTVVELRWRARDWRDWRETGKSESGTSPIGKMQAGEGEVLIQ